MWHFNGRVGLLLFAMAIRYYSILGTTPDGASTTAEMLLSFHYRGRVGSLTCCMQLPCSASVGDRKIFRRSLASIHHDEAKAALAG